MGLMGRGSLRRGMRRSAVALVLFAASCGSSADSTVTADASSVGVAREFCGSIANLGQVTSTESSNVTLINASSAARELLPADAPTFAADYLDAITESAIEGSGPSDAWLGAQHVQFAAYLGQQCPEPEFTEDPSFLGAIDAGLGANAGSGTDMQPDPDAPVELEEPPSTTGAPAAPPETVAPGEGPSTATEIAISNPGAVYKDVRVSVARAFSTNAEQGEIFEDFSLASNESWLILEVDVEALANVQVDFRSTDFLLSSPSGRATLADELSDRFGENLFSLSLNGRESKRAFLQFATDQLLSDLSGWTLNLEVDDEIPQLLPLTEEVAEIPYPITLDADGAKGITEGSNIWGQTQGCLSEFEVDLIEADIDIEAQMGSDPVRGSLGSRFLRIEVAIRNVTSLDQDFSSCGVGSNSGFERSSLRLIVDGRPIGAASDPRTGTIEVGSSTTVVWHYLIDSDVAEVSMVGDTDDKVFKTWTLDLPALDGE